MVLLQLTFEDEIASCDQTKVNKTLFPQKIYICTLMELIFAGTNF